MDELTKNKNFPIAALLAIGAGVGAAFIPDLTGSAIVGAVGGLLALFWLSKGADAGLDVTLFEEAAEQLVEGERPKLPKGSPAELRPVFDHFAQVASTLAAREKKVTESQAELAQAQAAAESLRNDVRNAQSNTESIRSEVRSAQADTEAVRTQLRNAQADAETARNELRNAQADLSAARAEAAAARADAERAMGATAAAAGNAAGAQERRDNLVSGLGEQMAAVEQTTSSMKEMTASLQEIAQHVEALALERRGELVEHPRDDGHQRRGGREHGEPRVERARDGLVHRGDGLLHQGGRPERGRPLAHRRRDLVVHERDGRLIDQVQSNANETARLSEEVAMDAEKGAESIIKIITEINRIKETFGGRLRHLEPRQPHRGHRRHPQRHRRRGRADEPARPERRDHRGAGGRARQGLRRGGRRDQGPRRARGRLHQGDRRAHQDHPAESKNAIVAVERGANTVDRGVTVSAEAERALKKILESSQKSTAMVRAIARATVEQAKGSKQVTDAIGRIAETVQQIAAATAEQARGSELIMKSAEKMRLITQHVERSSQEQARGGRQISQAIENISNMVNHLHQSTGRRRKGSEQTLRPPRASTSSRASTSVTCAKATEGGLATDTRTRPWRPWADARSASCSTSGAEATRTPAHGGTSCAPGSAAGDATRRGVRACPVRRGDGADHLECAEAHLGRGRHQLPQRVCAGVLVRHERQSVAVDGRVAAIPSRPRPV
jgi:hypothetical protein